MPGVTIDELLIGDAAERWAALGFTVADRSCALGGVRLTFTASGPDRGILGWSLRGVASTELDGLATTVSERPVAAGAAEHPNGVVAIDHVVAISPDPRPHSVGALRAAGP